MIITEHFAFFATLSDTLPRNRFNFSSSSPYDHQVSMDGLRIFTSLSTRPPRATLNSTKPTRVGLTLLLRTWRLAPRGWVEYSQCSLNSVQVACITEEAIVSRVEVEVFFADASEGGGPGSEDGEFPLNRVCVNSASCIFA